MDEQQISLPSQLTALEAASRRCQQYSDRNQSIRSHLVAIEEESQVARNAAEQYCSTEWANQNAMLVQQVQTRLDQLEHDSAARSETLQDARQRQIEDAQLKRDEQIREIRSRLDSELWVLQSVLDEDNEETPVRNAERAQETYTTQNRHLTERFNALDSRIAATEEYLASCHAGMDRTLPPPAIKPGKREQARTQALESVETALSLGEEIDRLKLPCWVRGARLVGIGLLLLITITIPVTLARADIGPFLNPQYNKPDWPWFGISAAIAFFISFLVCLTLLLMSQSRLRNRFESMLQLNADAVLARSVWEARCQQEIARLTETAETWKQEIIERREARVAHLRETAASRIAAVEDQHEELIRNADQNFHSRLQQMVSAAESERHSIDSWRAAETGRLQATLQKQKEESIQQINDQLATATASL
ncbi:MAG: hypothetical protein KDA96_10450, partial [Planctomycetaceae bacterium]|nr:hypothetical protein [Planctomycetaceae bacterium]